MQKVSKRLQTVLKLARLRQDQAAEKLGDALTSARAQDLQMQQLQDFQQDYRNRFSQLGSDDPLSASRLQNFQRFYGNLEQALETQQQRLELAGIQRDQARSHWQKQYARTKNMQSLIERKEQDELREEDGKVQREQDDRPVKAPSWDS